MDVERYNITLVRDYIDQHYTIHRIHADRAREKRFPLAHDFSIRNVETEKTEDLWHVENQILLIFSVEAVLIRQAFKEIVYRELEKQFEKQIKLKFFK
jgi:hypothetical protein